MSYTPTVWADGDLITAEKMNKLEQAVKAEPDAAKKTADEALSLAQTNEEDIRLNEADITELKVNSVQLKDERVADANQFTERNGFAKTSDQTRNLPVTGADAWGILLYLAENMSVRVGVQIFCPVDKAKKGSVWFRNCVRGTFDQWKQFAFQQEVQSVKTELDSLRQEVEQLKQQIQPSPAG